MKFQLALEQIDDEIHPLLGRGGMVASYIPALARVPVAQFGIALRTCNGIEACAGDVVRLIPVLKATENPLLGMKTLGLFVGMT